VGLLPDSEGLRRQVGNVLASLDPSLVQASDPVEASLLLVDLDEAGLERVRELRGREAQRTAWVIGITAGTAPLPNEVDDFVARERLADELPARLRIGLQRLLARQDAQARQRDLSLLLQLTSAFAGSLDVGELLHEVTRKLADQLGILRVSLVVLDEEREEGVVVAASDDPTLNNLRIHLGRYPEIREVARTGKPVLVEDAPSHSLLEGHHRHVVARGIRAIVALPVAVKGRVLGVLLVRASGKDGFSPREVDFLATVGHAIAIALRNARVLENVRGQTEREKTARLAAENLARELKRFEAYFAGVSDGIAILDAQGEVLSLNPAGCRLLEVEAESAVGQKILKLARPVDDAGFQEILRATREREVRLDVDLSVQSATGEPRTISVSAAPLDEGRAAAVLSFRDVTRARAMAEELRKTKEFLEKLIDSSVDAIIAADLKGRVILFNKGAEAITGYTAAEALERLSVTQLYAAGGARSVMAKLRSSDYGGKGRLTVGREEIIAKDGARVPVNMTASILYEGEREVASVGIFTDLRDRMQLEQKLSDAETRLEESERNAVIVALAGTAAHELNQPLTSVMGYAELLKRKLKESDSAFRPVEIIYREAERMAEIVRKIGKITRYETKTYVGASQILDLDKASSHEE
jgi:PAS domain S-box-containing protein